jgi:hypothetical protein
MGNARKLFRLLKFFNEYVSIKKYLASDNPTIDKYLYTITRFSFLLYWVFDNISILIKIKLIEGLNL